MKKNCFLFTFILLSFRLLMAQNTVPFDFIVAKDGSGTHTTIQAALDACPDNVRTLVYIKAGVYDEKVIVGSKSAKSAKIISLIGEDPEQVIIRSSDALGVNGITAFENATTFQIYANDFYAENITFENNAWKKAAYGQALALYLAGDRHVIKNCRLLGYQDTFRAKRPNRYYLQGCFISGKTDFIYAGGPVVFDRCTIHSIEAGGFISAPEDSNYRTTVNNKRVRYGFFFFDCRLTAPYTVAANSTYLGRPWQNDAGSVYINCKMGPHIKNEGWDKWNGENYLSSCFGEYNSMNLSGQKLSVTQRASWSYQFTEQEVKDVFSMDTIFAQVSRTTPFNPKDQCKGVFHPLSMTKSGQILSWSSVEGAIGYVVYKDGTFFAATTDTTINNAGGTNPLIAFQVRSISENGTLSTLPNPESKKKIQAFPSAEGFGKYATGGRGGKVVEVTNLDDYDEALGEAAIPGSFRWAMKQHSGEPITVVFRVSGTITLKESKLSGAGNNLRVKRDNFTIAGQTAPGEGICFRGAKLNFGGSNNFIIRNIRSRNGLKDDNTSIPGGSIGIENATNWIIDHCSFGWSIEENMTIYDNRYTTVQNCIIHEGLFEGGHAKGNRGYGSQWGGQSATYYHNLLAHNKSRSPRFNGSRGNNDKRVFIDFINNINYNWGSQNACYGSDIEAGAGRYNKTNFVNNYYKPGPATAPTKWFTEISDGGNKDVAAQFHINGNVMLGSSSVTNNNWTGTNIRRDNGSTFVIKDMRCDSLITEDTRFDYEEYRIKNLKTAQQAYDDVLQNAGPVHRDVVEQRIIRDVQNQTFTYQGISGKGIIDSPWNAEGYPAYAAATPVTDNDHDGMDDQWEQNNGLNPNDPEDRNRLTKDGYTALEIYLASLMDETIPHDFVLSAKNNRQSSAQVYPINVIDFLQIVSPDYPVKSVVIATMNGAVVKNMVLKQPQLNLSGLNKGYYIVTLHFETACSESFKICKL